MIHKEEKTILVCVWVVLKNRPLELNKSGGFIDWDIHVSGTTNSGMASTGPGGFMISKKKTKWGIESEGDPGKD